MQAILGSIARTLIAAIAGWLVSKGVVEAGAAQSFIDAAVPVVSGVLVYLVAQGWSIVQKRNSGAI